MQAFRSQVASALDELRAALADTCGDIWWDWDPPAEIRLKVGVAASGDPPAGDHVQAAKLVLKRQRLLHASDFIEVSTSIADLLADLVRVSAALGNSGHFATASLRTDSVQGRLYAGHVRTSVCIETVRGLMIEQEGIVEYATTVARGPVQIQACLEPGWEFAPIPSTRWSGRRSASERMAAR